MASGRFLVIRPLVEARHPYYGLIGNGAFLMISPGVRHPPGGSRCVDGWGARGRACDGMGSGDGSSVFTAAGATSTARGDGCAGAGVTRR